MKSIKEKSEEIFQIEERDSLRTELQRRKMRLCYEDGANYVLGIFEKELPLEDNRNLNDYSKALVWRLKNCIEQLKK